MSAIVTDQTISNTHSRCTSILSEQCLHLSGPSKVAQALEIGPFAEAIAWKIMVPIFTTVTGGLLVKAIEIKTLSALSAQKAQARLKENLGSPIASVSMAQREECVIIIHEMLKPLSVSRDQARKITDMLIEEAEGFRETDTE